MTSVMPTPQTGASALVKEPASIEDTGLDLPFLADLVLKSIYYNNSVTAQRITEILCLPYFNVIDRALTMLKREELVEVNGSSGFGELGYQYAIAPRGMTRVHAVMERSTYLGPAPVRLEDYITVVKAQAIGEVRVSPADIRAAFADLVLEEATMDIIGQAVNTGRSLFLFGHPGNGKTVLAEHIVPLLGGHIFVPHCIVVDGQIIKVLDSHNHVPVNPAGSNRLDWDRRWVRCERPAIIVGGELTLEALDLTYNPTNRYYEAPLQVKANGGLFLIDDFGRQQVHPRELLNRWIVPLEKRIDYLTLHTGKKIEVPFDQLIVFSTNLEPKDLVDEAFLRRIQNKVRINNPSPDAYREIFRRQCRDFGVAFDQEVLIYLLREYYIKPKRELRACHPRDLLRILVGFARYHNSPPALTPQLIDRACQVYFADL
jgi:predicted ATPase with chaperone activity